MDYWPMRRILYLFRRRIGKKWLRNNVVKITLIIIFPLYYWVGALAPDGSDTIFGVDVIYLQMIFFLSSIMASVPIFASEVFFRPASSSGVVSTVLLAAAVYSFTPFVSATIGNFNEAAFCVLVYLTLLLLMAGHAFGGPRWITAFSRFAMVLAVAAAFAGNFLLELGLTEFYREAVLVGLGFACIAFLLAALSFTKRSFP